MSSAYSYAYKDTAHQQFLQLLEVPGIATVGLTPSTIALITGQEGFERFVSTPGRFPKWAKATLPDGRRMLLDSNADRRRVIVESKPQVPGRSQWLRVVENEDQTGEGRTWIRRAMPARINLAICDWTYHALAQIRREVVPLIVIPPQIAPLTHHYRTLHDRFKHPHRR